MRAIKDHLITADLRARWPVLRTVPSARTATSDMTLSRIVPYFTAVEPLHLLSAKPEGGPFVNIIRSKKGQSKKKS